MSSIRFIQHNEPVTPEVANRPIKDVAELLSEALRRLEFLSDTANNILESQPLDEDVTVGAPVYFNKLTGRYSRARASARVDSDQVLCDENAYVIGVVTHKHNSVVGDICVGGVVNIDLEEGGNQDAQQDYQTLGLKWLSVLDGRLTDTPPSLAIPVLYVLEVTAEGVVKVCVCLNFDRVLSSHRHLRYELKARPSGSWSQGTSEITDVNTAMEGWLPVSEFSDVDIPGGAEYGYNIGASFFSHQFPLIAPKTFQVHWGQFTNDADPIPLVGAVPEELLKVTEDGIWWLSKDYLPWYSKTNWVSGEPVQQATPVPQSMVAYYTQVSYNTADAVVTSLDSPEMSGLQITDRNSGALATRGDLRIRLSLDDKRASEVHGGALALKHIGKGYLNQRYEGDVSGPEVENGFFYGPVVESLQVDSVNSELLSWNEDSGSWVGLGSGLETTTYDGRPTGKLLLRVGDAWSSLPLSVQSVHLDQMRDAYIGGMAAISFMPESRSGFSGSIYVPSFNRESASLRIRLTFVASATGSISDSMFTGKHVVIPAHPCNDQAYALPTLLPTACSPASDDSLNFKFNVNIGAPQMYFCIASDPIEVTPGAMVWFSFHKETGGFSGALSVIRMEAYLGSE